MGRVSSLFDSILHRRKTGEEVARATSQVDELRAQLEVSLKAKGYTREQLEFAHANWDPDDPETKKALQEVAELDAELCGAVDRDDLLRRLDDLKRRRRAGPASSG